jgi:deoxyribodipyrimidine photo-lyase
MSRTQLFWLRNDLRIHDNHALWHARQQGRVVAVCVLTPSSWQEHNDAPIKIDFWMRNLKELYVQLASLGIPLKIRMLEHFVDAPQALLDVAGEVGAETIFFNDEYGIHEQQRDDAVAECFADAGLACRRFTDQILFEPGSLLTQNGTMYKVYSQFRKLASMRLHDHLPACLPAPSAQESSANVKSDPLPDALPQFKSVSREQQALWPAGEAAAAARLTLFAEEILFDYKETRDLPAIDGTSRLSAYLVCGVISPRQCLHAALAVNQGELDSGNPGAVTWINELLWREFYKHILVCYPRVSRHRAFRPETEDVPWRDDPAALRAWQQGQTGIPIVDAAMRQLLSTGWMHNRLRMISAMFLTKNLLIDWREGERWFMRHLIDGDLAANNGGWQWSASTGTDSAPYFRVFNPATQSSRFDPEGAFIRTWVPELRSLDARQIHQPPAGDLFSAIDYPRPIVDLKETRKRAIDVFKTLGAQT